MAEAKQNRLWRLKFHMKAKSFDFKLKLQSTFPHWKLHRLSFILRIRKHLLKVESDKTIVSNFRKSRPKSRSRILRNLFSLKFLSKLKLKNRENEKKTKCQEAIRVGLVGVALLVFWLNRIAEKDGFIHSLAVNIFLVFLFVRFKTGKTRNLLLVLMITNWISSSAICFDNYLDCIDRNFKGLWESKACWDFIAEALPL